MQLSNTLPDRVRLLVIGGGIHGAGVLHDMASRGWSDVLLLEKGTVGQGTSSRSTKLIHGGLRYLQHIRDYGLVREGLRERRLLLDLASDLVKPIELFFPILRQGGMNALTVKTGLWLYDFLAGRHNIAGHKKVSLEDAATRVPGLNTEKFSKIYSFWDGQTDDLRLTRRVLASAIKNGAQVAEGFQVQSIVSSQDGWEVLVQGTDGSQKRISTLHIVNAAGPWANKILEASSIDPVYKGINIKGSHLLFKDMGLTSGLFLNAPSDKRIFFLLPWEGHTLLGTTEALFHGDQDQVAPTEEEVDYLLDNANLYLKQPLKKSEIVSQFAGLRWLALEPGRDMHATTRSHLVSEHRSQRGLLLTVYGGKLTAYRHLSQLIGDQLIKSAGEDIPTRTDTAEAWASKQEELEVFPSRRNLRERFV